MANDWESIHVGINVRLRACQQQRQRPVRILLGREHTRQFMRERDWLVLPRGEPILYSAWQIPILFNVAHIYGIAVESVPLAPGEPNRPPRRR